MAQERLSYTLDEGISAIGMGEFQYRLFAYAAIGAVGEAMQLMLMTYVGLAAQHDLKLSVTDQNYISVFTYILMLLGALAWGFVADRWGRKWGIFGLSLLTSVIGIASAFSSNPLELMSSLIILGFGIGGSHVYTSWYMEFIPNANRGHSMIWFFGCSALGTILEAFLAWIFMEVNIVEHNWRWLVGVTSFPSVVALLVCYFVPESPRFLCSHGRFEEAVNVLQMGVRLNQAFLPPGELVNTKRNQSPRADASAERNRRLAEIRNKEADLQKEIKVLGEKKKDTQERIDSLFKEKSSIETDLENARNDLEQQKLKTEQILDEKTELENQNRTKNECMRIEEEKLTNKLVNLEKEYEMIRNKEAELQMQIEELVEQKNGKKERIDSLFKEKSSIETDLENARNDLEQQKLKTEQILDEKTELENQNRTKNECMRIEEEKLTNKLVNLEKEYEMIRNKEAELQMQIEELVEQKNGKEERIDSLFKEKSSIETDLENARNDLEQQKLKTEQILDEKTELENQNRTKNECERIEEEKLTNKLVNLEKEYEMIRNKEAELQMQIEELVEQKNGKKERIDSFFKEKSSIEIDLENARNNLEQQTLKIEQILTDQSSLTTPLLGENTEDRTNSRCPPIGMLFLNGWWRTTFLIWALYFTNTFSYSSLVSLLSPSFLVSSIWRSKVHQNPSFYTDTLIVSIAELPGLGLAYWLLDWKGRKYTMGIMSVGGFFLSLLQICGWNNVVATSLVFGTRMFMSATFVALQIYTEEVYPTSLRATGVGLASLFGWVGGMLWPALGAQLETSHHPILLFGLYAFKIMISVICGLLLPIETLRRELEDNEVSE